MSLPEATQWLKATIAGIVLLGAFGSILAALLIWLAKRLLLPLIDRWLKEILKKILVYFIRPVVNQFVRLHFLPSESRVRSLQAYYALQIMKLCFALFVVTWCLLLFMIALSQPAESLLRRGVLLPLIISFLGFWYVLSCFAVVLLPLYIDIEPMIAEAVAKHTDKMAIEPITK